MPTLNLDSIPDKDGKHLTIAEFQRRLKEDPNDPEIRKHKEELEKVVKKIVDFQQNELLSIVETVNKSTATLLIPTIQSIKASQLSHFSESLKQTALVLQSYTVPNHLFEAINQVMENYRNLFEPMKVIGQIFASYEAPILYYKLPEFQKNIIIPKLEPPVIHVTDEDELEGELNRESEIFRQETIRLEQESLSIEGRNFHYDYLRTTFVVWQTNIAALNLSSDEGGMRILFEALYEYLLENGKTRNLFTEVFIPIAQIVKKVIQKGKKDANDRWVINTRSNIVKKINSSRLSDILLISEYDKDRKGYWFRVSIQVKLPKILS